MSTSVRLRRKLGFHRDLSKVVTRCHMKTLQLIEKKGGGGLLPIAHEDLQS